MFWPRTAEIYSIKFIRSISSFFLQVSTLWPAGPQSIGLHRVRYNWRDLAHMHTHRRKEGQKKRRAEPDRLHIVANPWPSSHWDTKSNFPTLDFWTGPSDLLDQYVECSLRDIPGLLRADDYTFYPCCISPGYLEHLVLWIELFSFSPQQICWSSTVKVTLYRNRIFVVVIKLKWDYSGWVWALNVMISLYGKSYQEIEGHKGNTVTSKQRKKMDWPGYKPRNVTHCFTIHNDNHQKLQTGEEGFLSGAFRGSTPPIPPTLWFWTSSLQSCERIIFLLLF